jgi:hypothetical protein
MASREWVNAHRELRYLRAASASRPRRRLGAREYSQRHRYAAERWRKYQAIGGRREHS